MATQAVKMCFSRVAVAAKAGVGNNAFSQRWTAAPPKNKGDSEFSRTFTSIKNERKRARCYALGTAITKVTFTANHARHTIQLWFGSSGGGLPRRPKLKCLGRFLIWVE